MSADEIQKLLEIIGRVDLSPDEKLLKLSELFPNKRLPGKKCRRRLLRKKFLQEWDGSNLEVFADKYDVTVQTLYNWIKIK